MKHFYSSLFAALLALFLAIPASAYDFEFEGLYYNLISENDEFYAEVTYNAADWYEGDIVIPEKVTYGKREFPVKVIGQSAFEECCQLTSVSIPSSIKIIKDYAFRWSGLSELTIPDSVEEIGKNLVQADGSIHYCPYEQKDHVQHGYKLKKLKIGSGIKKWGNETFASQDLEEIELAEGLETIGTRAFYDSSTKIHHINLPKSLISIGGGAFLGWKLKDIEFPESLETIGSLAFQSNDFTTIYVPNSVTSIGMGAFFNCWYLKYVYTGGVKTLGRIFQDSSTPSSYDGTYSKLEVLVTSDATTEISANALKGFSSLKTLVIGENVTKIGANAFNGCSGLEKIYSLNPTPPTLTESSFAALNYLDATVYVPGYQALQDYKAADYWKKFFEIEQKSWTGTYNVKFNLPDASIATVVARDKSGARLDPECRVKALDVITFEITPADGYRLKHIYANGDTISGNTYQIYNDVVFDFEIAEIGSIKDIPSYQAPQGTLHSAGNTFVESITIEGASAPYEISFDACPSQLHTVMPQPVEITKGSTFTIKLNGHAIGEPSGTTVYQDLRYCVAHVFTDWDGSAEFNGESAQYGEYRPSGQMTYATSSIKPAATGEKAVYGNYDEVMNISHTVTVPDNAIGHARIRVIYQGAWQGQITSAYPTNVSEGVTYDIPLYVVEPAAIDEILADEFDNDLPILFFNLQGIQVNAENLRPGIYIARQGSKVKKILIK